MTRKGAVGESVPDDAVIWRRIHPNYVAGDRPSSAAFDGHPEDGMTSVCVEAIAGTYDELMLGHDGFGLVWLTAGEARQAGFDVQVTHGDYVGHANLEWKGESQSARKRAQKRLAKQCAERWVIKPSRQP